MQRHLKESTKQTMHHPSLPFLFTVHQQISFINYMGGTLSVCVLTYNNENKSMKCNQDQANTENPMIHETTRHNSNRAMNSLSKDNVEARSGGGRSQRDTQHQTHPRQARNPS
jgi:hypothetical protein